MISCTKVVVPLKSKCCQCDHCVGSHGIGGCCATKCQCKCVEAQLINSIYKEDIFPTLKNI